MCSGTACQRVHWDTTSRRALRMLNVKKSLDVFPVGFYLKFTYNCNFRRKNVKKS